MLCGVSYPRPRRLALGLLAPVTLACLTAACGPGGDIRLFSAGAGVDVPAVETPTVEPATVSSRDATAFPYASDSIWNTALGDAAVLVEVALAPASLGIRTEAVTVLLDTTAPPLAVQQNDAGWTGADRCPGSDTERFQTYAPSGFLVTEGEGMTSTPVVAIQADGRSLRQGLPFARCTPNAPGTIAFEESGGDLYGDGLVGANGGSGLSALGGVLRLGELLPAAAPPRHALAVHVWGRENLWQAAQEQDCSRWPASRGDAYCLEYYSGQEPELRMGALLALPRGNLPALRTLAAQKLAWTLQNYGAYVVNDAGSSTYAFNVELGPAGWVADEFRSAWGFSFETTDLSSDWARDLQALFDALAVVSDNSETNVGGAGTKLQPALPALKQP